MKLAHCNVMSVGIFSWVTLEPEEGRYDFIWLDTMMDKLAANGMYAVLATPSGARPAWMSQKYPEVLRVNADGQRNLHGGRHNHCFSSPVYREKTHFQWRKSRGSAEKFHGAVVDHVGHEHTRVFRDVTDVGSLLKQLDPVIGTTVAAEVAVLFDWENRWVIEDAHGPRQRGRDYEQTCRAHYRPFWKQGIPVDVVDMDSDVSKYKLVIAPMLHMIRPGVAERLESLVKAGGVLITTDWSGIVNETDLVFLSGAPGPIRNLMGVWAEEIDALHDNDVNHIRFEGKNALGLQGDYVTHTLCDLIHAETAEVLATYADDFYSMQVARR